MIKIIKSFFRELTIILSRIIVFWPTSPFGEYLRFKYYKKLLFKGGDKIIFESGVRLGAPNLIEIGDNCIFGRNVNINAGNCNGIYIGNDVAIADGTYIRSANHNFTELKTPIKNQGHTAASLQFNDRTYSIVIEDDVWIGARTVILTGTHIGEGSIISANSLISNYIPPNSIVMGNPGRIIANRQKIYEKN